MLEMIPKVSVLNFKNMDVRYKFKGCYSFEFLKYETRWDCRTYRIYGVRCRTA